MIRWQADEELVALLRRYYSGEASTWAEILAHVEAVLHTHQSYVQAQHVRFRRTEKGYDVLIDDASEYQR